MSTLPAGVTVTSSTNVLIQGVQVSALIEAYCEANNIPIPDFEDGEGDSASVAMRNDTNGNEIVLDYSNSTVTIALADVEVVAAGGSPAA